MITDGCVISEGAEIFDSILSPGVVVQKGARIEKSIILTDTVIGEGSSVSYAILDKRVKVGKNVRIGGPSSDEDPIITTVGKTTVLPDAMTIMPGATLDPELSPTDFKSLTIKGKEYVQLRRKPHAEG
jgi:glucose-1-phosphate adenylyltransferase